MACKRVQTEGRADLRLQGFGPFVREKCRPESRAGGCCKAGLRVRGEKSGRLPGFREGSSIVRALLATVSTACALGGQLVWGSGSLSPASLCAPGREGAGSFVRCRSPLSSLLSVLPRGWLAVMG